MEEKLYIPIILGTAREGRFSELVASFVYQEVSKFDNIETEIIDVRDFRIKATDDTGTLPKAKKWKKIAKRADGFLIVSPEYNHSFPGELKMMLDLAYPEYARKPAAICGVSSGGFGGVRMVEQLRLVFITLKLLPIRATVYFSNVKTLFTKGGKIQDEGYAPQVKAMMSDLIWHANALRAARKNS